MFIYKIENKINGNIYTGQTRVSVAKRVRDHTANRDNTRIGRAIRKYGLENFLVETIDTAANLDELNLLEKYYIHTFDCLSPNGYNLTSGGDARKKVSEETKKRMSEAQKGRIITEKHRKNLSESHKGIRLSQEAKDKVSRFNKGKILTEEHKQKMKDSWTSKRRSSVKIRGEINGMSKLTEADVRRIRLLLEEGELTMTEIGKIFHVTYSPISSIKRGKTWRHI